MLDGIYQSTICFFVPYGVFASGTNATLSGLSVADQTRLGAYIAHPAVMAINGYILINMYRWDWLMLLIVALSDVFIFFWTGIYTSFTSADFFYGAANSVYQEATFWAVFFIVPILCLFPRYAIKSLQKVYFPYDVDIIREQEKLGMYNYLNDGEGGRPATQAELKSQKSKSSGSSGNMKHQAYGSVDEDLRPIYPPSTATRTTTHNQRSQNGSDSTNYTVNRQSLEVPPTRPSVDRARPSYDRLRASMDRIRPSFEASNDMTSAAGLARIESSHSSHHMQSPLSRFRPRLRGLSLKAGGHSQD